MREVEISPDVMAYALEIDEETVLIYWLETVRRRIPPTDSWLSNFDWRFYTKGHLLTAEHLAKINKHLIRCGHSPVQFHETNPCDSYIRVSNYEGHALNRCEIRDHLFELSPEERERTVAAAAERVAALEPVHRTRAQRASDRRTEAAPGPQAVSDVVAKCGSAAQVTEPDQIIEPAEDDIDEMLRILKEAEKLPQSTWRTRLIQIVIEHYL